MNPIFEAKNMGARLRIYDKYITLKPSLLSKDVTIPIKEISSIESGFINLEINTKDKRSYKITLKPSDKQTINNLITEKMID